jgi:hypothetical protein
MLHLFRSPHTCTHTNTYQHTYPHMYAQHTHTHIHPHPHTRIHTTHNSQTPHTCMGCTRSLAEGAAGRPALHALSTRFDSSCKATTCLPDSCAHRHKDTPLSCVQKHTHTYTHTYTHCTHTLLLQSHHLLARLLCTQTQGHSIVVRADTHTCTNTHTHCTNTLLLQSHHLLARLLCTQTQGHC